MVTPEKKSADLHPVSRVRVETLEMLFRGIKAVIENGCIVHDVTLVPIDVDEEMRRRSIRIGRRRGKAKKSPKPHGKSGRPISRPRKPGETDDDKRRRHAAERQAKKRSRDKQKAQKAKRGSPP